MYYCFHGADVNDQQVFGDRIDALLREVGDRGRLPEAVPPAAVAPALAPSPAPASASTSAAPVRAVAPAPIPALAPAPIPAPTHAPEPAPVPAPASTAVISAATPQRSFTPTLHPSSPSQPATRQQSSDPLPLIERLLEQDTKARLELEAQLQKQQEENEKLREVRHALFLNFLIKHDDLPRQARNKYEENSNSHGVTQAAIETRIQVAVFVAKEQLAAPQEAISDEQLSVLQARLEAVHASKLLSDDEFFLLEDLVADFVELQSLGTITKEMLGTFEAAAKLHKIVILSEKMASDAGFARQIRRKFVS